MKFTISSVEIIDAQLYGYDRYPNQYSGPVTARENEAKQLFIKGVLEDGTPARFYSPSTVLVKTSGMLNYKSIKGVKRSSDGTETNGWFIRTEKKPAVAHKNEYYYEGAKASNPPVYIEFFDEIKPALSVGDVIDIKYKVKGHIGKELSLWYVKLIKN